MNSEWQALALKFRQQERELHDARVLLVEGMAIVKAQAAELEKVTRERDQLRTMVKFADARINRMVDKPEGPDRRAHTRSPA